MMLRQRKVIFLKGDYPLDLKDLMHGHKMILLKCKYLLLLYHTPCFTLCLMFVLTERTWLGKRRELLGFWKDFFLVSCVGFLNVRYEKAEHS